MLLSSILVLSAATVSVFAAPVAQAETAVVTAQAAQVTAAHWNPPKTTTTTKKQKTTTTTTTKATTTTTTTTTTATASPTPALPLCKDGKLSFFLKAKALETPQGNVAPHSGIGQFIRDIGGPAGFRTDGEEFILSDEGFVTSTSTGNIFTVKTSGDNNPPVGDIMIVSKEASISSNWSPLRCNGERSGALNCIANNGNRRIAQACGNFINFDSARNGNCQEVIAFSTIPTCRFQ